MAISSYQAILKCPNFVLCYFGMKNERSFVVVEPKINVKDRCSKMKYNGDGRESRLFLPLFVAHNKEPLNLGQTMLPPYIKPEHLKNVPQ